MNEEELEKEFQGHYGFDPTAIITLIAQNPQIGLALVQLPIALANALIHKYNDIKWSDHPTNPGYYWVNINGSTTIKEYSSVEIDAIINLGNPRQYKYAGPLEPPQ
jgi:hypothetical protein